LLRENPGGLTIPMMAVESGLRWAEIEGVLRSDGGFFEDEDTLWHLARPSENRGAEQNQTESEISLLVLRSVPEKIDAYFRKLPRASVREIADAIGAKPDTVRQALNRNYRFRRGEGNLWEPAEGPSAESRGLGGIEVVSRKQWLAAWPLVAHDKRDALVGLALLSFMDNESGSAYPSMGTLAARTHLAPKTIRKVLADLVARGVLIWDVSRGGRRHDFRAALPSRPSLPPHTDP
jgi:hypothetical protein